jgi:hypothetical protein
MQLRCSPSSTVDMPFSGINQLQNHTYGLLRRQESPGLQHMLASQARSAPHSPMPPHGAPAGSTRSQRDHSAGGGRRLLSLPAACLAGLAVSAAVPAAAPFGADMTGVRTGGFAAGAGTDASTRGGGRRGMAGPCRMRGGGDCWGRS